MVGWLAGWLAN